ncbi:hypothetical protein P8C59_003544 [Phyllachora maydis]|uniref:Reverse transcriptase Ty1/copia-type domain-containing protein n=1 Tax=Phyllachora maydis TaxID=1825666 RepID=A0AAD9I1S5_9PEZI|nr:hypothetical protein P8C59_003544 [Phyllachora maydis]
MADILEESRNPAIEAYRAAHIANSSNSTPNSNSNPSKKGSYNLAIEEEEEESDSYSNSSSSSNSNTQLAYPISPASIGSITLQVLSRKALPTYTKLVLNNVLYLPNIDINIVSRVSYYNSGGCLIKETLYRGDRRYIAVLDFKKSGFLLDVKGSSKPILHTNFAFPLGLSSYTTKSIEPQRNKIVVEIPSSSIRKEDYRPIIKDAIVSEAIEPKKRYKLRTSPAKGTTLEGVGPSLRGKKPCRPTREPKPLTSTRDLPYILRELVIEGNKVVENAISSPTLKQSNIGQRDYYNLLNIAKFITKGLPNFNKIKEADFHCSSYDRGKAVRRVSKALIPDLPRVLDLIEGDTVKIRPRPYNRNPIVLLLVNRKILKTSIIKFIEDNTVLSQPTNNTALEGELVDLDLDLEGAISPDPSNLNTEKPISIEIGPSKLEPYKSSSDSKLDKPLLDKPINPVIVESTRPTISIRKPELLEAFPQTIKPIFAPKPIDVITPNQPITNEPLNNSDLILEGDKMQLDYYKLLAKTSSYILSFIYKARKRVISKDSTPTTYKQVLKLPRDKRSKWLEAITKEFIQLLELGVFKFLPRSLLPSNLARGFIQVEGLDYTITYASTSIPPTWRILLAIDLGVFYNAKTCYFIVTYIDDCLFIGPDIGYITDLKKRLNKVSAIEDLGPTAYFLGVQIIRERPNRRLWLNQLQPIKSHLNAAKNLFKYLNSTKDYSICFSYNGNTVANLGPKLSNSSNTTTKLSRDFYSKKGPRPLTTTSTTIEDSRNGEGSSRTSIINSSLVPIGFSNSDFAGDKATSKSTYGYLYKLAALHARTKHTLLKFRYVREQVKAKIVTIIYLNTKW